MRSILFGLFLLAASSAHAASLQVDLRPAAANPGAVSGAKAKVRLAPAGEQGSPLTAEVALPGTATFDVPQGSTWTVAVEAPGSWARPRIAVAGAAPVAVELLPGAEVAGEVSLPPGEKPPAEVTLRFQSPRSSKQVILQTEQPCPVRDRRFRCAVPAGLLELRVRARGYLSHYFWDVEVAPDSTLDLGNLKLQAGAAVVGWVAAPARDFRFQECRVELTPRTGGLPPTLDDEARAEGLSQAEPVDSRGFFQFTGIAPGAYELVVRHPAFAPARISPVEVLPGAETEVRPLELEPPVAAEITLEPPRDPYGQAWIVELLKHGRVPGNLESAARSAASAEGVFRASGLEPGTYVLKVHGSFTSSWLDEELELDARTPPRLVRLPFLEVRGEVTLGGEPLFALLWFGGRYGAVKIPVKTDQEGKFEVTLPAKEKWRVEVSNQPRNIFGVVPEVALRKAPGKSFARLAIDLPDTTVAGQVLDEQGKPVPGARVRAAGPAYSLSAVASTPEARFEFRGLAPGSWFLDAVAGRFDTGSASESTAVELVARQRVEDVQLVLRKRMKLAGIVVGPSGNGIPGAKVSALVEQETRLLGNFSPEAVTDVGGQFTLGIPAAAEGLQLTVLAPGFAVSQVRVDPRRADPLVLPVRPVGGTVVLDYRDSTGEPALLRYRTSLFHEYLMPPVSALQGWAEINGAASPDPARTAIPLLEPGRYTACLDIYPQIYRGGRLLPGLESRCASGELSPFGELVLRVPTGEDASGRSKRP